MDETWGLTWSQRWHKINPESDTTQPASLCGAWLYTQDFVRLHGRPSLLKEIVAGVKKAPTCKKCEKKVAATSENR